MKMYRRLTMVFTLALLIASIAPVVEAATYAEQRRDIGRVSQLLKTAERMAGKDRDEEAVSAFTEAQESLSRHATDLDPKLKRSFDRAVGQIERAHAKLIAEGLQLPALDVANAEPPMERRPDEGEPSGEPSGEVSFVNEIAPLFLNRCGRCHVQGTKAGLSLASYNSLTRGSKSGAIVVKGSGKESLLVQVLEGNEMPPSGEPISPEVTERIRIWIDAGAKFDGDEPNKPLAQLTRVAGSPAPPRPPEPPAKIPMVTGNETVSFAIDVAPILSESCTGCHGTNQTRAMLSMANFELLWKGGDSGPMIAPGNPDRSLLVQKLRGTAPDGERMPLNSPALSDDKIALVAKWISEGARFDGPNTTDATARVTALVRAERATSEELSTLRAEEAAKAWQLAIPDEQANRTTSERFLVIGNMPTPRLDELAELAETEATRVVEFFRQPDEPFNKARVTLFAFSKRIDYSEFGTMVERRQLPANLRGHSRYDLIAPYAALPYSSESSEETGRILSTELAALWVANQSKGGLPRWFVRGSGMAVASQLWSKDEEVRRWEEELPAAVASMTEPDAFMTGKLPPATSDLVVYGFVDAILRKRGNFDRLVEEVGNGKSFDEATKSVFRRSPKELAELWVASQRGR